MNVDRGIKPRTLSIESKTARGTVIVILTLVISYPYCNMNINTESQSLFFGKKEKLFLKTNKNQVWFWGKGKKCSYFFPEKICIKNI
jgi:hypothetical protein